MHHRLKLSALGLFPLTLIPFAQGQVANFDSLNSYSGPLELRLNEIRNLPALIGSRVSEEHAFFADYSYMNGSFDQEPGRYERDFSSRFANLGYEHAFGAWRVGALGSIHSGRVDSLEINPGVPDPATGRTDSDGWSGAVFAEYGSEAFTILAVGGLADAEHDIERSSDLGPTFGNSFSEFDTDAGFLSGTFKAHLSGGDQWLWSPYVTLGYSKVEADALTETGGPDRRMIGSFNDRQIYGQVGIELTTGHEWYAPVLSAAYWRDFERDDVALDVSAAEGTFLGTLVIPDAYDELFLAGLRVDGEIAPGWWGELRLEYGAGSNTEIVTLGVGVSRRF